MVKLFGMGILTLIQNSEVILTLIQSSGSHSGSMESSGIDNMTLIWIWNQHSDPNSELQRHPYLESVIWIPFRISGVIRDQQHNPDLGWSSNLESAFRPQSRTAKSPLPGSRVIWIPFWINGVIQDRQHDPDLDWRSNLEYKVSWRY